VATTSYLEDVAGGPVTAAAFSDEDAAAAAVTLLRESGVREQDISVIARDARRADRVAGERAWRPLRKWRGMWPRVARILTRGLPKDVRKRYGRALRDGRIVVAVAAGGQPADTIAALLTQARGDLVETWWQAPAMLFAPPELAGPF
jgi:hypothetical protein